MNVSIESPKHAQGYSLKDQVFLFFGSNLGWSKTPKLATEFDLSPYLKSSFNVSSRRVSRPDGGGGWKTLCIKIGYSEPRGAESG